MIDRETLLEVFQIAERKRAERRRFIKMAGVAAAATAGASMLAACNTDDDKSIPAPTPTSTTTSTLPAGDVDVLNFALNLEYLEANYYIAAAFGSTLTSTQISGTGTQGAVTGGRAVAFADATVAAYAREIAGDENAHVNFLRQNLGSSAVAQPAINIDGTATTGAFAAAARAAGIATAAGTFDPYANDDNFLLGAMLLSDVGVTAYKGSATLISNKTILEAAAGILAVEAYHTGLIRTLLYRRGIPGTTIATAANDRNYSEAISNTRDTLDGTTTAAGPPARFADDDQGVVNPGTNGTPTSTPVTINGGLASNIVPTDSNGIVFGRTADDVLNVVYQNAGAATSGGFFPVGLNGNIKASSAA